MRLEQSEYVRWLRSQPPHRLREWLAGTKADLRSNQHRPEYREILLHRQQALEYVLSDGSGQR